MSTDELKECPFCGGRAVCVELFEKPLPRFGCPACGIFKLSSVAWNRRAGQKDSVPENVRHALNEWADAATSALQWLRNIADGTTTDHQEAIENTLSGIQHAKQITANVLSSQTPAEEGGKS